MTAGKLNKESIQRKFNSDSLFPTLSSELFFYWVCSKGWPKIRIIRINYPTFSTWSTLGTIDPSTCSYERKKIQIEADTYGQGVVQAVRRTEYSFAQVCDSYYDYDISLCGGQLKKTLIKTVIIWAFLPHHTSQFTYRQLGQRVTVTDGKSPNIPPFYVSNDSWNKQS